MPTQYEYDAAARHFGMLATRFHDEAAWAPSAPASEFVGAGTPRDAIDDRIGSTLRSLVAAADDLRRLARECDRRAAVCRDYHRQLARYHALPYIVQEYTARPYRPATWVD